MPTQGVIDHRGVWHKIGVGRSLVTGVLGSMGLLASLVVHGCSDDVVPLACPESGSGMWHLAPDIAEPCGLPSPCDSILTQTGSMAMEFDNAPAQACMVAALHEQQIGQHSYHAFGEEFGSQYQLRVYAQGRAALVVIDSRHDGVQQSIEYGQLDPGYDFEGCAAADGAWPFWSCLRQGVLACESWLGAEQLCG